MHSTPSSQDVVGLEYLNLWLTELFRASHNDFVHRLYSPKFVRLLLNCALNPKYAHYPPLTWQPLLMVSVGFVFVGIRTKCQW